MAKKSHIPLESEFTDIDGSKWVQTSAEDLFSLSELNNVIESIEKEKDPGEIVLARIDFRTVNKEYHEAIIELQQKLKKKNDLLKRLASESQKIITRKNTKMLEMIEYIKRLQFIISYNSLDMRSVAHYDESKAIFKTEEPQAEPVELIEFEKTEEMLLDDEGEEVPMNSVN